MKNLSFNPKILLTKSKKPIQISSEISDTTFIFTFKDKTNKIFYEQYTIDLSTLRENEKNNIIEYLKNLYQKNLDKFNSSLRPYETKRIFLNVYQIQIVTNLIKM